MNIFKRGEELAGKMVVAIVEIPSQKIAFKAIVEKVDCFCDGGVEVVFKTSLSSFFSIQKLVYSHKKKAVHAEVQINDAEMLYLVKSVRVVDKW